MIKLFILGSANAIPSADRENTYFLIENGEKSILIDCGPGSFLKLQNMKIPIDSVSDLIVTHFHPDHVSGFPLLVMDWWLLGRKAPLTIHGLEYTLDRIKTLMELHNWKNWPNFFPVHFHPLPEKYATVIEDQEIQINSAVVQHLIPTIGLRFTFNNQTIGYSCDTEPCEGVLQLGRDADIFIHESAGAAPGHSTAKQCGADARLAGAKELFLIHFPEEADKEQLIADARLEFPGEVTLAKDMMVFE